MHVAPVAQKTAHPRRGHARPRAASVQIRQTYFGSVDQPEEANAGEREAHCRKRKAQGAAASPSPQHVHTAHMCYECEVI